jgi:DNA-binding XRE family transcriptional regulator
MMSRISSKIQQLTKPTIRVYYYPLNCLQGNKMLKSEPIPFEVSEVVKKLGENIRLARVRRRMRQDELAEKCRISRKTLYAIETGFPGIGIGTIFSVLWTLGLLDSAKLLAAPDQDEHGRILEAAQQKQRVRDPVKVDNDF